MNDWFKSNFDCYISRCLTTKESVKTVENRRFIVVFDVTWPAFVRAIGDAPFASNNSTKSMRCCKMA